MLQFVREIPIRIVIQKALSQRRGFLFHVSGGFAHEVDPLSGMAVNLVDVDHWMSSLKISLEEQIFETNSEGLNPIFAALMADARAFLEKQAAKQGAQVGLINFREERGFGFVSKAEEPREVDFYHQHHLELVPSREELFLLKLIFFWRHKSGCEADYAHAGVMVLKSIAAKNPQDLIESLATLKGHQLPTGTFLRVLQLQNLVNNSKLEL